MLEVGLGFKRFVPSCILLLACFMRAVPGQFVLSSEAGSYVHRGRGMGGGVCSKYTSRFVVMPCPFSSIANVRHAACPRGPEVPPPLFFLLLSLRREGKCQLGVLCLVGPEFNRMPSLPSSGIATVGIKSGRRASQSHRCANAELAHKDRVQEVAANATANARTG